VTNDKCLDATESVLCGERDKREAANHHILDNKVQLAQWSRWSLSF